MPNVDDHGLEVLKKAARNLDVVPKKDYALQVIVVKDESGGTTPFTPLILNVPIPDADTEVEIDLPEDCKAFVLRSRKISRLKLAYSPSSPEWVTIPRGGYWVEEKRLMGKNIYLQSSIGSNVIEVVAYT